MSPVDVWVSTRFFAAAPSDLESVAQQPSKKKILVVESQAEYDYCWAMQLMVGGEYRIHIRDSGLEAADYLKLFTWVYTTWDPSDPNRI